MAINEFASVAVGRSSPATHAALVTPSNSTDLATVARGVKLGVAGNLKYTTEAGDTIVDVGLAAGVIHPICISRIWATGTTATDITVYW